MADVKSNPKEIDAKKGRPVSEKVILGIRIIEFLVSKVNSNAVQVLAGIKQILFFYRLLPEDWKKKAYWIFERLWGRNKVVMSTEPEKPATIYNLKFDNDLIKRMFTLLPEMDQAIMLQGKDMQDLINKGLHSESDEVKQTVERRYGQRGLNIVNMLTTHDIEYLIDELPEKFEQKETETKFNEWSLSYNIFSLMISPPFLEYPDEIKKRMILAARDTIKTYILINLSGKIEDCMALLKLVDEMKEKKELNYSNYTHDIIESGFCKSIRIRINFK